MGMFIKLNTMLTVSSFFESIQKLMDSTGEEVNVVYEATGVYTDPVQRFLYKNNIRQYEICPLESAKSEKKLFTTRKRINWIQ
ncbi:MAG: hypothetical protein ACI317_10060 [Floccifex porci]|uniref:hypothetical protein n=1 Tax=Floccifex porci TaxID=2606629 RepID=UPI003EFECF58